MATMSTQFGDVSFIVENHVAWVEIHRPPHNFFDHQLVKDLADAFEALDRDPACRTLVLASEGKSFCAGADFKRRAPTRGGEPESVGASEIYREAVRLFRCEKPV